VTTRVGVWISIVMLTAAACGGVAGLGVTIGIDPTVIPQANYPRVIGFSRNDDEFTVTVALQASPYTSLVAIEAGDGQGGRYKGSNYQSIAPHVPWSFRYAQQITVEMPAAAPLDSLVITGEQGRSFRPLQFTLYPELTGGVPGLKPLEASINELNGRLPFYLVEEDQAHLTRVLSARRVDTVHGEEENSQRRVPLQSEVTLDIEHVGPGTMTVSLTSAYSQHGDGTLMELTGIDTDSSSPIFCVSEEGEAPRCEYTIQGDNTLSVSVWTRELDPDVVALIIPVLVNRQQPSEVVRHLVLPIVEVPAEPEIDPESD
jgi:hypothetical protein